MHLDGAASEAASEVIELDVGMIGEEGHGDGGVGEAFGNHERSEALAEGIVVGAGLPDGDFVGHPGFLGPDSDGHLGDHGHIASAAGAGVLREGDWMQLDDAGAELPILGGCGWLVFVFAGALERIVKGPVLDVALAALHDGAACPG